MRDFLKLFRRIWKIWKHPKSFAAASWYQFQLRRGKRRLNGPSILVYRHSGLGDVICSLPTVNALRDKYPNSFITYWTLKSFVPVIQAAECADLVLGIDESDVFQQLNTLEFDIAIYLKAADEDGLRRPHRHTVDDYAESVQVSLLSRQPKIKVPSLFVKKATNSLATIRSPKGPLVAIHTGPTWAVREWTERGWDELVAALQCRLKATVVQVGADVLVGAAPRRAYRTKGTIDLVGERNILETAALIQQCDLFIGVDSGLLHLAGAVGTHSVGIFGPVDPKLRLPTETISDFVTSSVPCLGCHHATPQGHWKTGCNHDIQCMKMLSADSVLEVIDKIITQPLLR